MDGISSAEISGPASFEKKFQAVEKLRTKAGLVQIVDITPEINSDQVPVLLIPGWGETPATHKATLKVIYYNQRRAIVLKYPRTGGQIQNEGDYPQAELKKAEALLYVIDRKGLPKVDVIAHSEGAINTIIAAQIAPKRFRNIVFVDPAGLTGKDNLTKFSARFAVMLGKDFLRNFNPLDYKKTPNRLRAAGEMVKYFAANPKRGLQEASAISAADIYKALASLERLGIGISIIHGVGDTIFPINDLLNTAEEKKGVYTIELYYVKGDHREVSVRPEKSIVLALHALNSLKSRPPLEGAD